MTVEHEKKENYQFIDAIRCIAMMFIVAEHCFSAGPNRYRYGSDLYWTFLSSIQVAKFGTITFFLLAGFLLGDNFVNYTPFQYFKRRLSNTVAPWLFWSILFILFDIVRDYLTPPIGHSELFTWNNIYLNILGLYKYSNYWFIINFMISLSILLLIRKFLYSISLGVILALFTIFYSVNIYYLWVFPNHTTAILGFVFFIWAGVQLRKNWMHFDKMVRRTPYSLIISLVVLAYFFSIYESIILEDFPGDKTNTLRFSNILYSLACFYLLLKIRTFDFLGGLRPRQTTYGIYLVHFVIIVFLLPLIFPNVKVSHLTPAQFVGYRLVWFASAYTVSFLIVRLISKTSAKRLVGN